MLLPIVGDGLVECSILILGDIIRFAHPNGLHVVEMFPLMADLLDFLRLLLLLGLLLLIHFLNLGLVIITLGLIFIVVIIIGYLLLGSFFSVKFDGESILLLCVVRSIEDGKV